ncbi:hypothetical protein NEUTE1DRAFT_117706 [Neurospora tetrasperma FGSC 2508]|uniref:Uncharacterized protein n=1 Tax=Neurospora tetrasperma (strain FGSC 2508 / ATCC MYA-4615 / P0657) TaxID=510951 RepID=F8MTD0_NEUT8|nr:uncharacterized protein NEUTE1DRAFT_117706 [Neurospora tetrasperma FGSC 2508]EGO55262.1 hypothetical protein NEUTE1DRAFT_117706 [Neurospora tetrasperma FGSC 2508]EGZ69519.1 hypothetical protein NEUTE2DRAFT_145585 [Neurospora tetrasperma FGSC 2509]
MANTNSASHASRGQPVVAYMDTNVYSPIHSVFHMPAILTGTVVAFYSRRAGTS